MKDKFLRTQDDVISIFSSFQWLQRIIHIVIIIGLSCSLISLGIPSSASAAYDEELPEQTSGCFTYVVNLDGSATITKYQSAENAQTTSVYIPELLDGHSVIGIDAETFDGYYTFTSISLPKSLQYFSNNPTRTCASLISIMVDRENPFLTSIDGVLFDKDVSTIIAYPSGRTNKEYTVPQGVQNIGEAAFFWCSAESIILPDGVSMIYAEAFFGCDSLISINLPNSLLSIGDYAFSDCISLESIIPPPNLISVGICAFTHCNSLGPITLPGSLLSIGDLPF